MKVEQKWWDGYKVVKRRSKSFTSTYMGTHTQYGSKFYSTNHITKRTRGYGPLAVFRQKASALNYMALHNFYADGYALFRCKYTASKETQYWRPGYSGKLHCANSIKDKRFADEVRLVEEVVMM